MLKSLIALILMVAQPQLVLIHILMKLLSNPRLSKIAFLQLTINTHGNFLRFVKGESTYFSIFCLNLFSQHHGLNLQNDY